MCCTHTSAWMHREPEHRHTNTHATKTHRHTHRNTHHRQKGTQLTHTLAFEINFNSRVGEQTSSLLSSLELPLFLSTGHFSLLISVTLVFLVCLHAHVFPPVLPHSLISLLHFPAPSQSSVLPASVILPLAPVLFSLLAPPAVSPTHPQARQAQISLNKVNFQSIISCCLSEHVLDRL